MHPIHTLSSTCIVGILLAAGFSRRFGQVDKLAQPLLGEEPLAVVSARQMLQALPNVIAVIRPGNTVLEHAFAALGVQVVYCGESAADMAESMRCAILAAGDRFPALTGYVLALADMPFIRPDTIQQVAAQLRAGAQIVQPAFDGQRGHPVGFARAYTEALLAVSGDQGARTILKQHAAEVMVLPVSDEGILRDIDTPEALRQAYLSRSEAG